MPPRRRASDKLAVRIIGWVACVALATSLGYTFVVALMYGPHDVDPIFFGLQALASLLFLIYSIRLRNRVFIAANIIALLNALGTILVYVVHTLRG
jgi:multisubunit Na+/H+ antiporter MnhF subunit